MVISAWSSPGCSAGVDPTAGAGRPADGLQGERRLTTSRVSRDPVRSLGSPWEQVGPQEGVDEGTGQQAEGDDRYGTEEGGGIGPMTEDGDRRDERLEVRGSHDPQVR